MRVSQTLELGLRPSRRLQGLIAAIHSIAAIAFVAPGMPMLASVGGLTVAAVSLVHALRRERRRLAGRVLTLYLDGQLSIEGPDGLVRGRVAPSSTDFGWAMFIQWQAPGDEPVGRRATGSLMLLPDALSRPENWPTLRAWLRHRSHDPDGARVA